MKSSIFTINFPNFKTSYFRKINTPSKRIDLSLHFINKYPKEIKLISFFSYFHPSQLLIKKKLFLKQTLKAIKTTEEFLE